MVHCKLVEWFGWCNIHNRIVWGWPCPSLWGFYVLIISECDSCRRTMFKKNSFLNHPHTGSIQGINHFFFLFLPQPCIALDKPLFHDVSPLLRSCFVCFVLFCWRIWFYFLTCLVGEAESQLDSILAKRLTFMRCCISQQLKTKGVTKKYFSLLFALRKHFSKLEKTAFPCMTRHESDYLYSSLYCEWINYEMVEVWKWGFSGYFKKYWVLLW